MSLSPPKSAKKHPRPGRPSKNPNQPDFRQGKLYKLLLDGFPQHCKVDAAGNTQLDVAALADDIGYSRFGVYRWFNEDRIATKTVKLLIAKSKGLLTQDELLPLVL